MNRVSRLVSEIRRQLRIHPIIAGVLTALMMEHDDPDLGRLGLFFAVNLMISFFIGSVGASLYILGIRSSLPARWWAWLVHAALIAAAVIAGTELALRSLTLVVAVDMGETRMGVWRTAGVVTLVVIALGITYERLRDRARTVELREQQARQELLEARLANLQARLNPHFLFNSLNTVAALIEEDRDKAIVAVEQLSDLLRYGLEGSADLGVPLGREIEVVRRYLAVEGLRFGARLHYRIDVEPGAEALIVPPLLLQPLVENAVKHGVSGKRTGGTVDITVRIEDGSVRLTVRDDGPGVAAQEGTQLGERTVAQRLALAYGDDATLETGPEEGGGYRARISLPVEGA